MLSNLIELSPAKINLFLKIISKRQDGYHNIRSGLTLINLFDEVKAEPTKEFEVEYIGRFSPMSNKFNDCIITKFFLKYKNKPNYKFTITKNIPIQSGLGSASSNLAAVLRILKKNGYNNYSNEEYSKIGADVPFFVKNSDSLIRGIGDVVIDQLFPKYYFLLVKPETNCSTLKMYNAIKFDKTIFSPELDQNEITENDYGNDFESYIKSNYKEIKNLLNFLEDLPKVVFTRVTGSGSCIFAAFESKKNAENSLVIFKNQFPNLWVRVVENNFL